MHPLTHACMHARFALQCAPLCNYSAHDICTFIAALLLRRSLEQGVQPIPDCWRAGWRAAGRLVGRQAGRPTGRRACRHLRAHKAWSGRAAGTPCVEPLAYIEPVAPQRAEWGGAGAKQTNINGRLGSRCSAQLVPTVVLLGMRRRVMLPLLPAPTPNPVVLVGDARAYSISMM
jgi:hypothetical protein